MAEFRKNQPVAYCVLAAVLGLCAMMLVDQAWTLGVDAGVLASVDSALPDLGSILVKLASVALACALLIATGRTGLLRQTARLGRGLACGAFLICFSLFYMGMGVSHAMDGVGSMPGFGAVLAFVLYYLLVGLGEELLGRAVVAETLLERFGLERRGVLSACGLSGLVFGLMHVVNLAFSPATAVIAQVVSATFAGILFAAIYFRCGNIWVTALLYALYDMEGSVSSLFNASPAASPAPVEESVAQAIALLAPMAFGVLIGGVALFLLRKARIGQVKEAWGHFFEGSAD